MDVSTREFITPSSILTNLQVKTKKQVLYALASKAAELTGYHEHTIYEVLLEREYLGSTGIGQGVAIPHGKLVDLERTYGLFVRLQQPIDFEAVDDQPVDLIFLILAPEKAGADNLKVLTYVSRLLKDHEVCEVLRKTPDNETLYSFLIREYDAHTAHTVSTVK